MEIAISIVEAIKEVFIGFLQFCAVAAALPFIFGILAIIVIAIMDRN